MSYHAVRIVVSKLDRECFESMAFRNVVLDTILELLLGKGSCTNTLLFIVGEGRGQHVAELGVPLSGHIVFLLSHCADLLF